MRTLKSPNDGAMIALFHATLRPSDWIALRDWQPTVVGGVDDDVFFTQGTVRHA